MLRLTANKTKLYTLVAHFVDNLPPMRSGTEFIKYRAATRFMSFTVHGAEPSPLLGFELKTK